MPQDFELIGAVADVEVIAVYLGVRERQRLKALYGGRHWRKLKGVARVRFSDGEI
jgi:hypothetical protein